MRLHLYKRGDIWWARGSEGGVKFRQSTRHTNERKAKLVRERWEREFADPTHFRSNQATIASAVDRWLGEIKVSMNPETVRFYEAKVAHVVRLLGPTRLAKIDHGRVLKYIERREAEGSHPHSIHRELTTLRLTLKSAQRAKEFSGDPKATIPRYKTGYEPSKDWRTAEEIWAAIAALPSPRGAAVAWCIATASDYSSLFTAVRLDVEEKRVRVRGTKTGTRDRWVPRVAVFDVFLRHALAYAEDDREDAASPLFSPWQNMPRDVRRACRKAGVPEFTARTLRRSAASWMVQAGVPYELAAKFLGHGSTAMLMKVYGQLPPEDAGRLIDERLK